MTLASDYPEFESIADRDLIEESVGFEPENDDSSQTEPNEQGWGHQISKYLLISAIILFTLHIL